MRNGDDALRSIRRWVGLVLDAPWDIQYRRSDDMERPSGILQTGAPMTQTGSAYIRDVQRDFDLFLYPVGMENEPSYGRVEAEQLAALMDQAFAQGVHGSRTMRLPVYDYDGVAWDGALDDAAVPYDFLVVSNLSIDPRQDPDEDDLYTVVVSFRISWREMGDISRFQKDDGTPANVLQDVSVHPHQP